MISTDITGGNSGGANQLLDLLSLVANPTAYEVKVKALQDATEENRRYVEAVAPVSEILALREDVQQLKAQTQLELEEAKANAARLKAAAELEAKELKAAAAVAAKKTAETAKNKLDAATKAEFDATAKLAEAEELKKQLSAASADFEKKAAELEQALKDAAQATADAVSFKALLVEKHTVFLKSL